MKEPQVDQSRFIRRYVEKHEKQLRELRQRATGLSFQGPWFTIGDEEYPAKRLQYATTSFPEAEVSPRIILYPTGVEDIHKAILLCRESGMAMAVRTGGHQYCGYSSTAPANMQLDLSETFPEYEYDADQNVLRCGVSHPLAGWAEKNASNGIYLPMGVCGHVHLGGHVHTGGWGMVARSHGLLADHVLAFEIIFADGTRERIVRPEPGKTAKHNDDVYYAVLGGGKGGDFGIVTHWEFSPLRDRDYPNSACYAFMWIWSRARMERVVQHLSQFSALCADGTIPSDYEFMVTITGTGVMDLFSDPAKEELHKLSASGDLLAQFSHLVEEELAKLEQDGIDLPVPPMIQLWMCFTNKQGGSEPFDDQWFESFTEDGVCGDPLIAHRERNFPVSRGLAKYFIIQQDREMQYPFVKRFRVTMDVPERFAATYAERMDEIMGIFGWKNHQHLVSQMQIYQGGAIQRYGELGITSYSWREQALAMSHDSFYSRGWFYGDYRKEAERWQQENDEVFVGQGAFSDRDMRMFAYTFGNRNLDEVWHHFYDSAEKYQRLRRIKGTLDPDQLFVADDFSVKPL